MGGNSEIDMSGQIILGIDFSGAQDAGRHIWITEGTVQQGTLDISTCEQATAYFNCSADQDTVYQNLVDMIDQKQNATIGIDFPFAIPEVAINVVFNENRWDNFAESQRWSNLDPENFRDQCTNMCHNELRDTDAIHRADCPHSIRVHKQTYYGISEILEPLLQRNVSVAPLINTNRNVTVLETYPAATLARENNLFASRYKTRSSTKDRRRHNVQELAQHPNLNLSNISTRKIIDNTAGDALDSMVAALATFDASHNSSPFSVTPVNPIEGHIFA